MRILLSNDDGYFAPGLAALAEALTPLAQIPVVAPQRPHFQAGPARTPGSNACPPPGPAAGSSRIFALPRNNAG